MDGSSFNKLLHDAREHGKHDYQKGVDLHDEYSDVYLQQACRDGYFQGYESGKKVD